MNRLFHVAVGFEGPNPGAKTIQDAFGAGVGWARYAPNCWIVSTNENAQSITERVRKVCSEKDSIYVVEINLNNDFGYLQKEIWDWLRSFRR
jgi:hypothetical protein